MKTAAILIALLLVSAGCTAQEKPPAQQNGTAQMSSGECSAMGGEIINTLDSQGCPAGKKQIAEVEGLRCPCVCCA